MAEKSSAQEVREAQRVELRKQREKELSRQKRVRTAVIAAIVVVALALVAGLGYLLYQEYAPEPDLELNQPTSISKDEPMLSFKADDTKPVVDVVFDYMCPFCGNFEQINSGDLHEMIENGDATVNFHVRTFLSEKMSTTQYSARAGGAAVCTYEDSPEVFLKFHELLFANQPAEGGPGLNDRELEKYAKEAGAKDATISCIKDQKFRRYATDVLEPAAAKLARATPAVIINGKEWGSDGAWQQPGALKEAVSSSGSPGASDAGGASDSGK
ncbi:DsbA family protein [Dermabacter sp. p3-SID358]|uniref:DsbA family protein n=1 Tax=Dermabacter sp. p3-SID358 TaxID=2916114 RepID=UPI0021A6A15D|nr:DsbA family protein [Dermabacter sp. p3-SID358]MCT1867188.1 DsbA family protein [Dermabacter sp. p3-SID358]